MYRRIPYALALTALASVAVLGLVDAGPTGPAPAAAVGRTKVVVTSPAAGETVSGTATLAANATNHPYGVTSVRWLVDDAVQAEDNTGPNWSAPWDSTNVADGTHSVTAEALADDGSWTASRAVTFSVANTSGDPSPSPTPSPSQSPSNGPSATTPCGTATTPPAYQHVVWILMENKSYGDIIGNSNAPYINSIAGKCSVATNFYAEAHPSLPNYIAMTSGSTQGITDDSGPASHQISAPSIFSLLGPDWRSLEESMPSNCYLSNSGLYAVRHNPAAYYTNVRTECSAQDVPLADTPDLLAKFTFVTPNVCNDMHSCSTADTIAAETRNGDQWLSTFLPKVLNSPEYTSGSTVVFLTWDEDDNSSTSNQHIATVVMAPSTPAGGSSSTKFDHYSILRTTEALLGLPDLLGAAATATSMRSDFGL